MRSLTTIESNQVAGGFINAAAIFEGFAMMAGIGMVAAFGLGAASVFAYQYFSAK